MEAARRGLPKPTRPELVTISRELSDASKDPAILPKMLLDEVTDPTMTIVGTAQIGQVLYLRKRIQNLVHIELVTAVEVRYHRALRRAREEGKELSLNDFKLLEIRENTVGSMIEALEMGSRDDLAIANGEYTFEERDIKLLSQQDRFSVGNMAEYQIWDDGKVCHNNFWNSRKDSDDRWVVQSEDSVLK